MSAEERGEVLEICGGMVLIVIFLAIVIGW